MPKIQTKRPYKVTIRWGELEPETAPVVDYEFATEEELTSFLYGADEASGWMNHTVIGDDDEICSKCRDILNKDEIKKGLCPRCQEDE